MKEKSVLTILIIFFFFTTILDVLEKNSGQLLKSLKCGSKWKLLKNFKMYNVIIKKIKL